MRYILIALVLATVLLHGRIKADKGQLSVLANYLSTASATQQNAPSPNRRAFGSISLYDAFTVEHLFLLSNETNDPLTLRRIDADRNVSIVL